MRVLVACEFSGIVRDAFRKRGHEAVSCDLLPCEKRTRAPHLIGDVLLEALDHRGRWDMMIAFPPCTRLCSSGARWFKGREQEQQEAVGFVRALLGAPIQYIALENPVGVLSSRIRKPEQIVHPWQFWDGEPGEGEVKATCLWLKGLPKLIPTTPNEVGRVARVHHESPGPDRWQRRSRTATGLADAMADQWGSI